MKEDNINLLLEILKSEDFPDPEAYREAYDLMCAEIKEEDFKNQPE